MAQPTVIIAGSLAFSLTNFRGPLIAALVASGCRVIACAPEVDPQVIDALKTIGAEFRRVPMARTGLNPLRDLKTCLSFLGLFLTERPDLVLAYTQKPIIYAGLALRLMARPRFVAMITGLGYVFSDAGRSRWLQFLTARLYRSALRRASEVLVFNRDDRDELLRRRMIRGDKTLSLVPGSGVDMSRFRRRPVPSGPPTFLLVARLLADKGIREFAAAADIVRAVCPAARFQLLGPFDTNPSAISAEEIAGWVQSGQIEYLGATRDVCTHLARCTVYVLPSYREGLPRTVVEAMAVGRAIITTDAPGCRETVEHGQNGLLVRPRDVGTLAEAMLRFCADPMLARDMGSVSRTLAKEKYDAAKINRHVLDLLLRPFDQQARTNHFPDVPPRPQLLMD